MRNPVTLRAVETAPASPEAVARLMGAALAGGRALSLDLADRFDAVAAEALSLARVGDAVPAPVRDMAGRLAHRLNADAASFRALIK